MSVSGIIENIVRHHLSLYEEDLDVYKRQLSLVLFLYVCHSIHCLQLVHSFSATVGSKKSPPSWWSEA